MGLFESLELRRRRLVVVAQNAKKAMREDSLLKILSKLSTPIAF